jgi:hypothetical protein
VAYWFTFVGFLFQIIGVGVTVIGFRRTWREFASGPFPPKQWVIVHGRAFAEWVRRVILRRQQPKIVGSGVAVSGGGAFTARGRIGWGPLSGKTAKAQIIELEQRVKDLANSAFNKTDALEDSVVAVRRDIADVASRLDEAAAKLEQQTRTVAVGGIVWESFGLLLVVIGLALQAVGFVFGGAPSG